MPRRTLEERLLASDKKKHNVYREAADRGRPAKFPCPRCDRKCHPFELVEVEDGDDIDDADDLVCTRCLADHERERQAGREKAALQALPAWEQPAGREMKAERGRRIDKALWTVGPSSPLTDACQLAYQEYIGTLHRMTVDATPETWDWPDEPELSYKPLSQQPGGAKK